MADNVDYIKEASYLEELINRDTHNEDECKPYLGFITRDLIKGIPANYNFRIRQEIIESTGKPDYIIITDIRDAGDTKVRAFVWELKAPQLYIYEYDTLSRVKPTENLTNAENQLLHYCYELKKHGLLKDRYNITDRDDVCLGGIIIGRDNTKVRDHPRYDNDRKKELFKTAYEARKLMYGDRINFMTWNDVVHNIRIKQVVGKTISDAVILEEPLKIPQTTITDFMEPRARR